MIICYLIGGLGNQLFQYAAGRALSHRLRTALKLNTSIYKRTPNRTYDLHHFNIQATSTTPLYDAIFPLLPRRYGVAKLLKMGDSAIRKLTLRDRSIFYNDDEGFEVNLPAGMVFFEDPMQGFDDRFLSLSGDVYLKGYWQSERYFAPIADTLRQELTFRTVPNGKNQALIREIRSKEAVSLHIRRSHDAIARYGACDLDYYHASINKLLDYIRTPHFFIFSDHPEWARLHLKIDAPCTYISHNTGPRNFEDLRLMSQCKHFIIANSTFSWWGAWLATNPDKQVICPQKWYPDPSISIRDLIPENWIQV